MSNFANTLVRHLAAGRLSAAEINSHQASTVLIEARRITRRRQMKIERLNREGRVRLARREQYDLLKCVNARLDAARYGLDTPLADCDFAAIWHLSEQLKQCRMINDFVYAPKLKRDGRSFRHTLLFGPLGRAQRKLSAAALTPFACPHPSQYMSRDGETRGRPAACKELLLALNEAEEGAEFVHTDVVNFFDAISHRWLEDNLPLPLSRIRNNVLLTDRMMSVRVRLLLAPVSQQVDVEGALRRGIPQGSATSSATAEFVVTDILRSFAGQLNWRYVANYSDNFGFIVDRSADAAVLEETLGAAFLGHPAGGFRTTTTRTSIHDPFSFLGYMFVKPRDGRARAYVRPDRLEMKDNVFTKAYENAGRGEKLKKLWQKIESWAASYALCPGAQELMENHRQQILEIIETPYRRFVEVRDTRAEVA